MGTIDLRSDTVTCPTPAMRTAMARAEVGDDVYGEDPTINALEAEAAARLGTEAAVFCTSGTQGNLLALLAHCGRGDEYIAGQGSHAYLHEGGGAAVLGGIQPQPVELEPDGTLDLARVATLVKPDDDHYARTRLLCLENTQAGRPLPTAYLEEAAAFCRERGLGLHMDGARLFNAAVALGEEPGDIARHADSVSICLSKGLGAPVGSVLCGSRDLVREARHWRKALGGGLRQAGILAAAGLVALEEHVDRLEEDHRNARRLAEGLDGLPGLRVQPEPLRTNMVFVDLSPRRAGALADALAEAGIRISAGVPLRLVTHLDVSAADVERVITEVADFCRQAGSGDVPRGVQAGG